MSLMQAAARFPDLATAYTQRTHAVFGRYETMRSFVGKAPTACSPLQHENDQIHASVWTRSKATRPFSDHWRENLHYKG